MTTAVVLGLTLAFEPKENGLMVRPPRDPSRPIITGVLTMRIVLVGVILLAGSFGLFEYELALGSSEPVARTVAVAVFVVVLGFYLLNARSLTYSIFEIGVFSNPMIWLGIGTMAILQALYTYLPVLGSAPIDAAQWGRVFLVGFAAFFIIGFQKRVHRRMSPSPGLRSPTAAIDPEKGVIP